jgi:hypothetical protein
MKSHLLKCSQKNKNHQALKQLTILMQEQNWACRWHGCSWGFCSDPCLAAAHLGEHLATRPLECLWNECGRAPKDSVDFHAHLLDDHGVHTPATIPIRARFCIECGTWILSDLDWSWHELQHAQTPHRIYGPVIIDGILAAPRRCPYCSTQGIFQQIDNHTQYINHVEQHIDTEAENSSTIKCPHRACEQKAYTKSELKKHLRAFHAIPLP